MLSKVKTSAKIEIKQALYYLEKALKQNSAENPVQTQLSQLNAKIDFLLRKQDTTITITQKVVEKAVETVKKQSTNTTFTYAQKAAQNMSAKMPLKMAEQTQQNTVCETSITQLS